MSDQPRLKPSEATLDTEVTAATLPETDVVKKPVHSKVASPTLVSSHTLDSSELSRGMQQTYTRLPKLLLPTFDGQALQWQSFWDSFTAAVYSNPGLTPGQKLNYLRA